MESYLAPTLAEHTLQQLGLTITTGLGLLFCQASTKMGCEIIYQMEMELHVITTMGYREML